MSNSEGESSARKKCKFLGNLTLISHQVSWSFVKLTFHYCKSFAYELHLQSYCLSEEKLSTSET